MRESLARYRALRDAVLAISSDLSLDSVLQNIVDVARDLIECRYAALGVLREDGGGLSDFLVSGMNRETIEGMGAWPRGLGLLGVVLDDPRPLRVANIANEPRSVGFPPGHPPMKCLIAAPIAWHGRVHGNFYLTDKIGADAFDEDDEEMLITLAAHAAVAIENATLYSHTDQKLRKMVHAVGRAEERSRFLVELSELLPTGPIVDEPPFDAALERLTGFLGDACVLCLTDANGVATRQTVVHRDPARLAAAEQLTTESWSNLCEQVFRAGRSILVEEVGIGEHAGLDDEVLERHRFATAMALPVRSAKRTHGVFLSLGSRPLRFSPDDLAFGQVVADRLGTAIENARLLKELEAALRAREELVSIATHELRTPVTVILANTDLAKREREETPERVRNALDVIARQAKRLAALTDELLDVSRLRSGRMTMRPERRELGRLVQGAVERFRAELPETDRDRLTLAASTQSVWGEWDEMRIEQVLLNLLTNAFKFSPDGGEVHVSIRATGDNAAVVVRDHGIGIAVADLAHLFEPFFRARSATDRRIRGFGLGLHICRAIAEEHGGQLVCESVEREGSMFTLALPVTSTALSGTE